jgi:hypothetical protein
VSRIAQGQDAGHRHPAGMADAEPPCVHATRGGGLGCAAAQAYLRRRPRGAVNDDIGESNARAESGSERLQHRLLCGETACQAFDSVRPVANFIKLVLDEATGNQRIARILDPSPEPSDIDQIYTMSDDIHVDHYSFNVRAAGLGQRETRRCTSGLKLGSATT